MQLQNEPLIEQNKKIMAQNEVLINYKNLVDDMAQARKAHFEGGSLFLNE